MANNLTAAQRLAFRGATFDGGGFRRYAKLIRGATTHDISDRVHDWGRTSSTTFNAHPARRGDLTFPTMAWTATNDDRLLSPRSPDSLFYGTDPTEWTADFEVYETLSTGSPVLLVKLTFDVAEVQLDYPNATILSAHPLARYWAKWWRKEDRQPTDWNGNAHTIAI